MKIRVFSNNGELGKAAATQIAAEIISSPNCVLGLASGSSALETYGALISMYRANLIDFSKVTAFFLDEYEGLSPDHEQGMANFIKRVFANQVNFSPTKVHHFDGNKTNFRAECDRYEVLIESQGGIDIQILGIGTNCHIAFNEPSMEFSTRSHRVALTDETIEANKRFFASVDEVPRFAYTMGIGTIFSAKKIILIAKGSDKAEAIQNMVEGPVSPQCPASILQLHPEVEVLLNEQAASRLTEEIIVEHPFKP